ncbi:MAG: hypothetical protein ABJH05_00540 [Fulvivirga sp.]
MDILTLLLPIITLILGWSLSQTTEFVTKKRNDKKKLNHLLFNLLELRWLLKKSLELDDNISNFIEKISARLSKELGTEAAQGAQMFQPILSELLKDKLVDPERVATIEKNIDLTISDLADIYPVYAYELSGRYNIREKLEKFESYMTEVNNYIQNFPSELIDWVQPKLSNELLAELDDYIMSIAAKIGWKTKKKVKMKLLTVNQDDDLDQYLSEYIDRIKTMANRD